MPLFTQDIDLNTLFLAGDVDHTHSILPGKHHPFNHALGTEQLWDRLLHKLGHVFVRSWYTFLHKLGHDFVTVQNRYTFLHKLGHVFAQVGTRFCQKLVQVFARYGTWTDFCTSWDTFLSDFGQLFVKLWTQKNPD